MPLMGTASVEEAITVLARNAYDLRRRLGRQMTLKYVPELRFLPDLTFDRLEETRRLFLDEVVQRDIATKNDVEDET